MEQKKRDHEHTLKELQTAQYKITSLQDDKSLFEDQLKTSQEQQKKLKQDVDLFQKTIKSLEQKNNKNQEELKNIHAKDKQDQDK